MNDGDEEILASMPVGYRFLPTDEELFLHYLLNKISGKPIPPSCIQDIDAHQLYSIPPHQLDQKSNWCRSEEWFFFIHQNENFNDGWKTIRMVGNGVGFWKSNGQERLILDLEGDMLSLKISFNYYVGQSTNAKKTQWMMEEYRLQHKKNIDKTVPIPKVQEWVLGRITKGESLN